MSRISPNFVCRGNDRPGIQKRKNQRGNKWDRDRALNTVKPHLKPEEAA